MQITGKPSDPNIIASPRVNLGIVEVTSGQTGAVIILNTGQTQALEVSGITTSGLNTSRFTIDSFPASIVPGESGDIRLGFDAKLQAGLYQAVLEFATNDPDLACCKLKSWSEPRTSLALSLISPSVMLPGANPFKVSSSDGFSGNVLTGDGSAFLGVAEIATGTALQVADGVPARVTEEHLNTLGEMSVSLWVQANIIDAAPHTLLGNGEPPAPSLPLILLDGNLSWFVDT